MSKEERDVIRDRLNIVANMLAGASSGEQPGPAEAGALMDLTERLFFDINRGADALERLAAAQEGRLEVERVKAGLMAGALSGEPQRPAILRPAPPPPPRG